MNLFHISLEQIFKQVYNISVIVPFIDPGLFWAKDSANQEKLFHRKDAESCRKLTSTSMQKQVHLH